LEDGVLTHDGIAATHRFDDEPKIAPAGRLVDPFVRLEDSPTSPTIATRASSAGKIDKIA
jgi:hypothetical protein